MTEPPDPIPSRRAWLRASVGAVGSLIVASKLSACTDSSDPDVPATAPGPASRATDPAADPVSAAGSSAPAPAAATPPAVPVEAKPSAHPEAAAAAEPSPPPGMPPAQAEATPAATGGHFACPAPASFAAISDAGPRATFARMDRGDQLEWWTVGIAAAGYAEQHADTVLHVLRLLDRIHAGYPLSVLSHSLQAATRALRANASDELVLCALCHHLGMAVTFAGQAELSASILRGFVSDDAYRIVRHQEEFQLLHYGARVDRPTSQRERYAGRSWYAQACSFCDEWDSPSYATDYASLPLAEFEPLVREKLGTGSGYLVGTFTSQDCLQGAES